MNRITILAATAVSILLLPPPRTSAQVRVAVTGGVNVTSLSDSELKPARSEATWRRILGVSARVGLHRHLGIEIGGSYSRKGGQWLAEEFELDVDMIYFEMTAMGRAVLPLARDRIRAHLAAGPALGWATRYASDLTFSMPAVTGGVLGVGVERERSFLSLDHGIAGAAGLEFQLSEAMGITLEVARKYGLLNVKGGKPASCPQCTPGAFRLSDLKLPTTTLRGGFVYSIR